MNAPRLCYHVGVGAHGAFDAAFTPPSFDAVAEQDMQTFPRMLLHITF